MSKPQFDEMIFYCVLVAVCAFLLGCTVAWRITDITWQLDANARGHAEYYIDGDHEKQWRWMTRPEEIEAAEPKGAPDTEKQP